jgi:hypothetical protein
VDHNKPNIIDYASPRPKGPAPMRPISAPGPLFGVLIFILFGMFVVMALALVLTMR